ncbi:hypothetical protein [Clostridium perfringens]|uniref:hypothetical protein n=1 Tax=Clostridium perfringens TaxID=1502 RepID=UPI0013142E6E|nr:hypothetical protein [Clostridium perfringens]
MAMREDDITKEMKYIENTFDNRDSIKLYDYFAYKESIDIRKKTNEFINDLDLDELFRF